MPTERTKQNIALFGLLSPKFMSEVSAFKKCLDFKHHQLYVFTDLLDATSNKSVSAKVWLLCLRDDLTLQCLLWAVIPCKLGQDDPAKHTWQRRLESWESATLGGIDFEIACIEPRAYVNQDTRNIWHSVLGPYSCTKAMTIVKSHASRIKEELFPPPLHKWQNICGRLVRGITGNLNC